MCFHYQTLKDAELLLKKFGVTRPGVLGDYNMWRPSPGVLRPRTHYIPKQYQVLIKVQP